MADIEVTQRQYEQLIEDAAFLQDESEALKYVIDSIPYDLSPPEKRSVKESLQLIDYAQMNYFRPIIERAVKEKRPIHLGRFDHFEKSFKGDSEADIHKTLDKIGIHRAALLNLFQNISLIDWEIVIYDKNENPLSLYDFAQKMIKNDRQILKEIAELVMIFENEKQAKRELEKKQKD
ncbi:MAG: hypothetical protein ACFCU6_07340 [Balneolaceae bacterium]